MTSQEPSPRRGRKGERTRERILDSAMELFSRSGFNAVSLRDIAAHAGLTHAGLLHHFPGKESLLTQVLGRRDEVDLEVMSGPEHDFSPEDLVPRVIDQVERNMRTPGLVSLYVKISGEATDPEHPAHEFFVRRYRRLRKHGVRFLTELFAHQTPPLAHDPDAVAQQLIALLDGLQTQWLLDPDTVDMRTTVAAFFTQLGLDQNTIRGSS
ncbi:TetR/AcrR family transcriptional regulator [Nonomuraea sp. NN258]|uniref:TetR/AcrR family transcriptional regulator n=1 Tax=Nonomuraea antri TaxID=2730852 RepID=UPI001567C8E9|nr:TetR/AcrR family transcriptional regulator [Nonomuraea antri]NRQ32838.1 TetR/AcrR family transcriptional regulator [Nonomuraea antri]